MKNFIIPGLALLLLSCTPDHEPVESYPHDGAHLSRTYSYPGNTANIYDEAGYLHNEISEAFLQSGDTVSTTAGIITAADALANLNADFMTIKPFDYVSPTALRIDKILGDDSTFPDIIGDAGLSSGAAVSLTVFVDSLMSYRALDSDFDVEIYPYIIGYEQDLIDNSGFSTSDLEVLLTTSSIARHAFYFAKTHKRKPRDRDWDISIGNISAGTEGILESQAKAVMMATVAGLKFNH